MKEQQRLHKKRHVFHFNVANYLVHLSVIGCLEILKFKFGQPAKTTAVNSLIFSLILFINNIYRPKALIKTLILIYQVVDCISYNIINTPLTKQVIESIDIKWVYEHNPEYIIGSILLIILIYWGFEINISDYSIEISYIAVVVAINAILALLYLFINNFSASFNGEKQITWINSGTNTMLDILNDMALMDPIVVNKKEKTRNLILLQLESFERSAITPKATPYLYNLTQKYAFIDNIDSSAYTTWTTAGTFITQCGLPQIIVDVHWFSRHADNIARYKQLKCLPDYLATIGYKRMKSHISHDSLMGLEAWRSSKNYSHFMLAGNDKSLFGNLARKASYLDKLGEKERFVLFIQNLDTHHPHQARGWCKPENKDEPNFRQCHNCLDQVIRSFINEFLKLNMQRHTTLVIYPDHIAFGRTIPEPRKLFMLFPGMDKRVYRKNNTYYDFLPTILDLIGIKKLSPGFPFGSSVFSDKVSRYPSKKDLNAMFNFFRETLNIRKKNIVFKCRGKNYTQTEVCDDTTM